MSIKKQNLKKDGVCKVTFSFNEKVNDIENIRITGDFNNWDVNCEPMKKLKTGEFSQTLSFEPGKAYQFKYLINDSVWANDPECDELVPNGFGPNEYNSIILL